VLLGRIFLSAWLLVAVQLWIALRHASFVPALATGIGGTFFAVVATSAGIGVVLPWQIPVNQLASDADRALLALAIGTVGGLVVFSAMLWAMSRREVV
jgi:ABC-2 type transport system permease protein